MKRFCRYVWRADDGVLSFEWVLLLTLLVIGIVSGLAGVRDAITDELGDIAEATVCFDQSFTILGTPGGFLPAFFDDDKPTVERCDRVTMFPP